MLALTAGNPSGPAVEREAVDAEQAAADVDVLAIDAHEAVDLARRSSPCRRSEPLKTNENGIVGKPAEPTVAPGGSVAADACVAGAGVPASTGGVEDDELDELLDDDAPPVDPVGGRAGGVRRASTAAGPWPPAADSFSERKSIRRVVRRGSAAGRSARAARRSWARPCRAWRPSRSPCRSGPWPAAPCAAFCCAVGELLAGRVDLRLQVGGLLALGRQAHEPEAGERRRPRARRR